MPLTFSNQQSKQEEQFATVRRKK